MRKLLLASCAAAGLLYAGHAQALVITVTGEDNFGNTATNSGGSPINFGPATVGTWSAQGSATGTPPLPLGTLFSNTVAINSGAAGTFTLWVTENGLTGPLGDIPFLSSLTTNLLFGAITSVTETTSLQTGNTTPGPGVPIGTVLDTASFTTSNQTQSTTLAALTGTGPYSLTERYVVNSSGIGGANLTIDLTSVPEPASLAIFGTALLGLGGLGAIRRRRKGNQS